MYGLEKVAGCEAETTRCRRKLMIATRESGNKRHDSSREFKTAVRETGNYFRLSDY